MVFAVFSTLNYCPVIGEYYNAYARIYKNVKQDAYIGTCPKCRRPIRIRIGEKGTDKRFFEAYCI